jgi:hypothetical protein
MRDVPPPLFQPKTFRAFGEINQHKNFGIKKKKTRTYYVTGATRYNVGPRASIALSGTRSHARTDDLLLADMDATSGSMSVSVKPHGLPTVALGLDRQWPLLICAFQAPPRQSRSARARAKLGTRRRRDSPRTVLLSADSAVPPPSPAAPRAASIAA